MNRTFPQGFYQGMLVHQRATGRVDQDGGRLHLLELFLAEDMIGIGGIRGVQGYEIGFRQKLFLGDVGNIQFGLVLDAKLTAIVVDHIHAQSIRPFRQGLADTSHTDNAQGLSGNRHTEVLQYTDLHVLTKRTQLTITFRDTPGGIQHQA